MKYLVVFILSLLQVTKYSAYLIPNSEHQGIEIKNGLSTDIPNFGETIKNCLTRSEILHCFRKRIIETINEAIQDNSTWHLNDYVILEKNQNIKSETEVEDEENVNNVLLNKVRTLAESRSIRLASPDSLEEGRKKKDKGDKGGYAMVGGMAMIGMMAQMFMGKVLMLAGGAFILAKIALLFSVINGLKKSSGGSSGTDHVIYTDGGGGGGHSDHGWQRSNALYAQEKAYNSYKDNQEFGS